MSDTTNISDLPNTPGNNITLEMKEKPTQQQMSMLSQNGQGMPKAGVQGMSLGTPQSIPQAAMQRMMQSAPQTDVNQIVTGIQNAAAAKMTALPSRDIPMMTHPHTQDKQSRPNYIPQPKQHIDYIKQHDSIQSMIQKERKQHTKEDRLEDIYEEMQTPIFVMILFFIFRAAILSTYTTKTITFPFYKRRYTTYWGISFKNHFVRRVILFYPKSHKIFKSRITGR